MSCVLSAVLLLTGVPTVLQAQHGVPERPWSFDPPAYLVYRASGAFEIDGRLSESDWQRAEWTTPFVDIRGQSYPTPRLETRAKLLWDDKYLYVAGRLEEPDIWATMTRRDAPVYRENAFEVFIDPDGDAHDYYELEINALGTVFDLMPIEPSRDGGPSVAAWDIRGLKKGIHIDGTINDPSDTDEGWTVEFAIPWSVLEETAPDGDPPVPGDRWRLNFARSEWPLTVVDGSYEKAEDGDGEIQADWWTWAPQGAVNMHMPERFGYMQFVDGLVGSETVEFIPDPDRDEKWLLRRLYYKQRLYYREHGHYAPHLADLNAEDLLSDEELAKVILKTTQSGYELTLPTGQGSTVHLIHDGRVWVIEN